MRVDPDRARAVGLVIKTSGNGPLLLWEGAGATEQELEDPDAWALNAGGFRDRIGPFSALELLGQADQDGHHHLAAP